MQVVQVAFDVREPKQPAERDRCNQRMVRVPFQRRFQGRVDLAQVAKQCAVVGADETAAQDSLHDAGAFGLVVQGTGFSFEPRAQAGNCCVGR